MEKIKVDDMQNSMKMLEAVNDLIDEVNRLGKRDEDLGVAMKKIASLEGEIDKTKGELTKAQKALFKLIGEFGEHSHNKLGLAVVPASR